VSIPADAIKTEGTDQAEVFVVNGHALEHRAVRLGARNGSSQVVVGGLSPGELVALGNLDKMHDGQKVRLKTGE